MARSPRDRLGPPPPAAEQDRAAFQALAGRGAAERALQRVIVARGMGSVCAALAVSRGEVVAWVRAGAVPEEWAAQVVAVAALWHVTVARDDADCTGRGRRYTAEVRGAACASALSARAVARELGCGHQTVMRWRRQAAGR